MDRVSQYMCGDKKDEDSDLRKLHHERQEQTEVWKGRLWKQPEREARLQTGDPSDQSCPDVKTKGGL